MLSRLSPVSQEKPAWAAAPSAFPAPLNMSPAPGNTPGSLASVSLKHPALYVSCPSHWLFQANSSRSFTSLATSTFPGTHVPRRPEHSVSSHQGAIVSPPLCLTHASFRGPQSYSLNGIQLVLNACAWRGLSYISLISVTPTHIS